MSETITAWTSKSRAAQGLPPTIQDAEAIFVYKPLPESNLPLGDNRIGIENNRVRLRVNSDPYEYGLNDVAPPVE
jgi:hypothetical protein